MHAVVLPWVLQSIQDRRFAREVALPIMFYKFSLMWLILTKCMGLWPPYLATAAQSNSSVVPLQIRMKEKMLVFPVRE